jgi:DNA-binding response OmpR family regulator
VRDFLCRELAAEGYRVRVAGDGREVLGIITGDRPPDLLILDLEIPYGEGLAVLELVRRRKPSLAVIIHSFPNEYAAHPTVQGAAAFVEKMGNTDSLKAVVSQVLRTYYPDRFAQHHGRATEQGGQPIR